MNSSFADNYYVTEMYPYNEFLSLYKKSSISSDNGLVPSGTKPLPEPMMTEVHNAYGISRPQRVNQSWTSPACMTATSMI